MRFSFHSNILVISQAIFLLFEVFVQLFSSHFCIISYLAKFSHQFQLVAFFKNLSLCDSMSPYVSRTLLSILADLNYVLVCMVSILPLISNSFSTFSKTLSTVQSPPSIIGNTLIFNFHSRNFIIIVRAPTIICTTVTLKFHNFICSFVRFSSNGN